MSRENMPKGSRAGSSVQQLSSLDARTNSSAEPEAQALSAETSNVLRRQDGPDGKSNGKRPLQATDSNNSRNSKDLRATADLTDSKSGVDNENSANTPTISPDQFDAVLFDMDGVVTRTAAVHFAAWKSIFDAFLKSRNDESYPFTQQDYLNYVDGKPREDGVESFLKARRIDLPAGEPGDAPGLGSRAALAAKKD